MRSMEIGLIQKHDLLAASLLTGRERAHRLLLRNEVIIYSEVVFSLVS